MARRSKYKALGLLRMEIENLKKRGFGGLLCLGTGSGDLNDSCEECPLLDLVPPQCHQTSVPCLHIPLNERGGTLETVLKKRGESGLEEELLRWMEETVERLEQELAGGESPRE
jgi:hypothetical protein